MKIKEINQIDFSSLLFDTLFGLILFFNIDLFLDIKDKWHFIFYLFGFLILVHWWLVFKSADDAFGEEVENSALDIVMGIIYVIFIDYFILLTRTFEYQKATIFLLSLLTLDLIWALVWRFIGEWQTKDREKIKLMEKELNENIGINVVAIVLFAVLSLVVTHALLTAGAFVALFIVFYLVYIILTFKTKIIDIKTF